MGARLEIIKTIKKKENLANKLEKNTMNWKPEHGGQSKDLQIIQRTEFQNSVSTTYKD